MADDDMRKEIEELRAQMAELTAERKAREREKAQASDTQALTGERETQESEPTEAVAESEKPEDTDLASRFQELAETIDQELKDASPITVLVVFALGVLVGRLLPR